MESEDKTRPGSIGPVVVNVIIWPSVVISTCKIRPTSKGSRAYTGLVAPEIGQVE